MYSTNDVDISRKYIEVIFDKFKGEICLLGGWAVYELVNTNFKINTGRDYIGSRDIDIGFQINPKWTNEEFLNSDFCRFLKFLDEQGFILQSFRFFKDYDINTLNVLTEEESSRKLPFEILRIYVDIIIDYLHPCIEQIFNFIPIDEPVLSLAFNNNLFSIVLLSEMEVKIVKPHLLLAMKLNSVMNRNKEDKKIKDIMDIYALIWFSDLNMEDLKKQFYSIYSLDKAMKIISNFTDEEITKVSNNLGISKDEIKLVLSEFIKI